MNKLEYAISANKILYSYGDIEGLKKEVAKNGVNLNEFLFVDSSKYKSTINYNFAYSLRYIWKVKGVAFYNVKSVPIKEKIKLGQFIKGIYESGFKVMVFSEEKEDYPLPSYCQELNGIVHYMKM